MMITVTLSSIPFLVMLMLVLASATELDNYQVAPGHKSFLVAMGCFWCGEQAFEQYVPGVVEAVSGYAGGEKENPTYYDHYGHYEVVLVEYDPSQTSYEVLVEYALRNIDPFNANGQFCDFGFAYRANIFYMDQDEKEKAEAVLEKILAERQNWDTADISVPIVERPTFWKAEEYHQDYYIKNPGSYGYYKKVCRRENRLREVWGDEEYDCYHTKESDILSNYGCFDTVSNSNGEQVELVVNNKHGLASEPEAAILPTKYWAIIGGVSLAVLIGTMGWLFFKPTQAEVKKRKASLKKNRSFRVV